MKHSLYNYYSTYKDYHLIFNGLKSTCIILDNDAFCRYKDFSANIEELKELQRLGFIISDSVDEFDELLYRIRKIDFNKKTVSYRILTTTECNAKCFYCYESRFKKQTMTIQTAQNVADFILKNIHNETKLNIQWFGGEPLCNMSAVDVILDSIKLKKNNDVAFQTSIVTNGLLLNESLIQDLYEKGNLKYAQITLDGCKQKYEEIKKFKVKDAFEKVVKNIHCLLNNKIEVQLRLNYNEENFEEIIRLIDYLSEEFPDKKYLKVYGYYIFDEAISVKDGGKETILLKKLIDIGFNKNQLSSINSRFNSCMAHSINGGTIMPNGDIVKCCRGSCLSNGIVGNINNNFFNNNIYDFCSNKIEQKCISCKYMPICGGGCLYERFVGTNSCLITEEKINFILLETLKTKLEMIKKHQI